MATLTAVLRALLQAALGFLENRLDKRDAARAQRELGARDAEGEGHDLYAERSRMAADVRARPGGGDDELDSRLRAPTDRGEKRPD